MHSNVYPAVPRLTFLWWRHPATHPTQITGVATWFYQICCWCQIDPYYVLFLSEISLDQQSSSQAEKTILT